jgi:hypothetical protein
VPPRVSVEEALKVAGEEAVYYHTKLTGASNGRAKAKLGFVPRPLLWKGGASECREGDLAEHTISAANEVVWH